MQGFLLGLASGATCLAYCAPVLVPFLLGEGNRIRQNWGILARFLIGRLGGYLLFALLAWATNRLLLEEAGLTQNASARSLVFGAIYVLLAGLLLFYGLAKTPTLCAGSVQGVRAYLQRWPALLPLGLGFLTGLNLCPPFLLAFTGAVSSGSLLKSLFFFTMFFLGTSLYMLPMPFLGAFSHVSSLRTIGKLAALLMAAYYLYSGVILLAGGVIQL